MELIKTNLISCLSDNPKQWIGWKGYFADYLVKLKEFVERDDKDFYGVLENVKDGMFYNNDADWQFFYPVEPPEEKKDTNSCDKCTFCNSLEITKGQIDYFCRFEDNLKITEKNYYCSDYCEKGVKE